MPQAQNNMFAELLAQISGANPNWAYDDAQVSQLDDAFKRQFAEQQQQQESPYALPPLSPERPLDVPTPAPQIPAPQMPTPSDLGAKYAELYPEVMSQHGAEARQVPGIPTATGGLDPARLGEIAGARRLQAEQAQGIPSIPTATPGMNRPTVGGAHADFARALGRTPVHQMPRSQRMGKPMSPMFEGPQRQPGMMRPSPGNPVAQRRQSGMSQPLQPLRQQQQAPQSQFAGYSSGNRNIGSSRMPNTGQMTSSYGGQRQRPTTFGAGQPGFAATHGAAGRGAMGGGGSPHLMNQPRQRTGGPTTLNNFIQRESFLSPGG